MVSCGTAYFYLRMSKQRKKDRWKSRSHSLLQGYGCLLAADKEMRLSPWAWEVCVSVLARGNRNEWEVSYIFISFPIKWSILFEVFTSFASHEHYTLQPRPSDNITGPKCAYDYALQSLSPKILFHSPTPAKLHWISTYKRIIVFILQRENFNELSISILSSLINFDFSYIWLLTFDEF